MVYFIISPPGPIMDPFGNTEIKWEQRHTHAYSSSHFMIRETALSFGSGQIIIQPVGKVNLQL